jgi:hypothetical protein
MSSVNTAAVTGLGLVTPPSSPARIAVAGAEEDPRTRSTESTPARVPARVLARLPGMDDPHTGSSTLRPTEYKKWEYVSRIDRDKGILQYITEKINYLNYKNLKDEDLPIFLLGMPVETLLSDMFELKKKLNEAKETTKAAMTKAAMKKTTTVEMEFEQAQDEQAEQAQAQKELDDAKKKEDSEYEALKKYITELKTTIQSVEDDIVPSLKTTIQSVEGDIVPSLTNPRSRSRNLKRASRHGSRITRKHK